MLIENLCLVSFPGCEKDVLIDILTQRCNSQRLMIAEAYRDMYGRVWQNHAVLPLLLSLLIAVQLVSPSLRSGTGIKNLADRWLHQKTDTQLCSYIWRFLNVIYTADHLPQNKEEKRTCKVSCSMCSIYFSFKQARNLERLISSSVLE